MPARAPVAFLQLTLPSRTPPPLAADTESPDVDGPRASGRPRARHAERRALLFLHCSQVRVASLASSPLPPARLPPAADAARRLAPSFLSATSWAAFGAMIVQMAQLNRSTDSRRQKGFLWFLFGACRCSSLPSSGRHRLTPAAPLLSSAHGRRHRDEPAQADRQCVRAPILLRLPAGPSSPGGRALTSAWQAFSRSRGQPLWRLCVHHDGAAAGRPAGDAVRRAEHHVPVPRCVLLERGRKRCPSSRR